MIEFGTGVDLQSKLQGSQEEVDDPHVSEGLVV